MTIPSSCTQHRPLRVIHSEAATDFAGQERYIYRQMIAMRALGHHMEAICQSGAQLVPKLRDAGFTVHTVPMDGALDYVKGIAAVCRILGSGSYDVLNTHSRTDTLIAAAAGRLMRTPLVVRTRHLARRPNSLVSYTWLPHRVIVPSNYVRRLLMQCGVPESRIAIVYPSIGEPTLLERSSSTLRTELGLDEDAIVIGCVAMLRPTKGHKALVEATARLMTDRPKLHLVLVGNGSPVFEQLQDQIQSLGVQGRVHLMGARVDVPNLMAGFDLFAQATEIEASGTVYAEAQASGLAVVGTDAGGVSEMFVADKTGLLVPLHDGAALTEALRRLVDDPELRRTMGAAGHRRIWEEGHFSNAQLGEQSQACYRRWLAERGFCT